MSIVIDPAFSVYRLLNKTSDTATMLTHRRTMSRFSYEIENATLIHGARNRIFAGFQRLSKFIPQLERYRALAQQAERIYVFGWPDAVLPRIDNITYVHLDEDHQLVKEWFLVSHGPEYYSTLATEELSDIDDPDEARSFVGLWTFDLEMVQIIEEWLASAVDAPQLNIQPGQYNPQRQVKIMSASIERLLKRQATSEAPQPTAPATQTSGPTAERLDDAAVAGQVRTAVKERMQPQLAALTTNGSPPSVERDAVIFFSDIRNFTRFSEEMAPRELVARIINPYVDTVSRYVQHYGGVIDKFLGDGVLAVFGLDGGLESAADNALAAAVDTLTALQGTLPDLPVGIGLARGKVLVGQIGTTRIHDTTVIGDAVNVAARLSSLGHTGIWFSDDIYRHLNSMENLEPIGSFSLKGKSDPQEIYRYSGTFGT